jgi:hypothetical protein
LCVWKLVELELVELERVELELVELELVELDTVDQVKLEQGCGSHRWIGPFKVHSILHVSSRSDSPCTHSLTHPHAHEPRKKTATFVSLAFF